MQYYVKFSSDKIRFQEPCKYCHLCKAAFKTSKQVSVNKQPDVYCTLWAPWKICLMISVLEISFSLVSFQGKSQREREWSFSNSPNQRATVVSSACWEDVSLSQKRTIATFSLLTHLLFAQKIWVFPFSSGVGYFSVDLQNSRLVMALQALMLASPIARTCVRLGAEKVLL